MDIHENLLTLLPALSRAKIERLLSDRALAHAALRAASDSVQEARRDLGLSEGRAREMAESAPGYEVADTPFTHRVAADQRSLEARLAEPVEAARRRLDLANDAHERAAERWRHFAFLDTIAQWLGRADRLGGMHLAHHAPATPKTRDPAAEVAKLRAELVGLDDAWAAAEAAPAPLSELKSRAIAEIDAIAAKGAPDVDVTARAGSPVALADHLHIAATPIGEVTRLSGDAGASFFCWLMRDEIAAKVGNLIDAAPHDGAMTDDEREREFRRISIRRLEIERIEEALVCAAEAEGRIIARRRDADPRALLEVAEV